MHENLEYTPATTVLQRQVPSPEPVSLTPDRLEPPSLSPATDGEVLEYLRSSVQWGELATQTENQMLIRTFCDRLNITVSEAEWQAAGDAFRLEHQLFSPTETLAWLAKQRISAEAWSEGIRINLLTQKLKEVLFGETVDTIYISDRENYRRVALSQILVTQEAIAQELVQTLREQPAAFCRLALEHSKGKQSQTQGGFVGIRFLVELLPEIRQAIANVREDEIVDPVQTRLGYHILKVEKWYPSVLNEPARAQMLSSLWQNWLHRSTTVRY